MNLNNWQKETTVANNSLSWSWTVTKDAPMAKGPTYQDATYKYFGEAAPGSALTDPVWRVSRMNLTTSQLQWADGNVNFDNVYTDLATVAAMAFA